MAVPALGWLHADTSDHAGAYLPYAPGQYRGHHGKSFEGVLGHSVSGASLLLLPEVSERLQLAGPCAEFRRLIFVPLPFCAW